MELKCKIEVGPDDDPRSIELYEGDLTALPAEHAVDILVVSAFPDDYLATSTSLIGALNETGLSISELASIKALDLRTERSCWLSGPIDEHRGFDRILCFEPLRNGTPPEVVDDIFDSLEQVLLGDYRDASVAMPVVATGDMGWPVAEMGSALLKAAVARLRIGLPLKQLKIVESDIKKVEIIEGLFQDFVAEHGALIAARPRRHPHAREPQHSVATAPAAASPSGRPGASILARSAFGKSINLMQHALKAIGLRRYRTLLSHSSGIDASNQTGRDLEGGPAATNWDCFVSYSREDAALVDKFIEMVRSKQPDVQIFRDSEALRTGNDWISALADAIDSSHRFVAIFSPAYFDSKWCKREFNAAILRDDQGDDDLLFPIFLREDSTVPSLYLTFNYIDCREADLEKLTVASERLVAQLYE